ncbi:hypothetical protein AAE478_006858 [Parahypoxylon ruwenzoriense]
MSYPRFPQHNLYKVLEVDSKATTDEIKKAYRKLCLKVHPDKAGNTPENNERFSRLNEAFSILSDELLRKAYDRHLASQDGSGRPQTRGADDFGRRKKEHREGRASGNTGDGARYRPYPGGFSSTHPGYAPSGGNGGGSKWERTYPPPGTGAGPRPFSRHGPPPNAGPPPATLGDRVVAGRIRVGMRHASRDLDTLYRDFKILREGFDSVAQLVRPEDYRSYWMPLFNEAWDGIDYVDELFVQLDRHVRDVEAGRWTPDTPFLPQGLGIILSEICRMALAASAALFIVHQLGGCPWHMADLHLADLSLRLQIWARPLPAPRA